MACTKTDHRSGRIRVPRYEIPTIKTGTPVQVNWLDIVTESHWVDKDVFIEMLPLECITVGIWMKPGTNCIHIASNINEKDCDGTTIPIGCVLKVKVIGHA
jgi:hypothetical protein